MKSYKKILVIQLGRIGDVILMTPLLKALKTHFPEAELHFLSGRNNRVVAEHIPYIDTLHVYEKKLGQSISLMKQLRKEAFDLWIDPKDHYSGESRYFAKFAQAKESIGFNDEKKKTLFTISLASHEEQFNEHIVDRNLKLLKLIDIEPPFDRSIELHSNKQSDEDFEQFLGDLAISKFYLINISASKANRYWDLGKWIEFIQLFPEHDFIISGDPNDHNMIERILKSSKNAYYFPTKSIIDVYSLVKYSNIVISPDTSIIHIAAAFNKAVIGLYANLQWNLNKFYPLSSVSRVLINEESDSIIRDIPLEELTQAFDELLIETEEE